MVISLSFERHHVVARSFFHPIDRAGIGETGYRSVINAIYLVLDMCAVLYMFQQLAGWLNDINPHPLL